MWRNFLNTPRAFIIPLTFFAIAIIIQIVSIVGLTHSVSTDKHSIGALEQQVRGLGKVPVDLTPQTVIMTIPVTVPVTVPATVASSTTGAPRTAVTPPARSQTPPNPPSPPPSPPATVPRLVTITPPTITVPRILCSIQIAC